MSHEFEKLKQEIDRFISLIGKYEETLMGFPNALNDLIVVLDNDNITPVELDYRLQLKNRDEIESIVKTMKSNSILMLYNLVESTVRTSMFDYYDRLKRKKYTFSETVESIQKLWIKNHLKKVNDNELNLKVFQMIKDSISSTFEMEIERESFYLSGNADIQEIKKILKTHGIGYDDNALGDYGGALLTIKNKRNSLAHGNVSFEENGRDFSIDQINELKNKTYACLEYFISLVDNQYC